MNPTQIADNIHHRSWLQLLVDLIRRVYYMLHPQDQARYAADFAPYLSGSSVQYLRGVANGELAEHLQRIGRLMSWLVDDLAMSYADEPIYQILRCTFYKHFVMTETDLQPRPESASWLLSPTVLAEAYRQKRGIIPETLER